MEDFSGEIIRFPLYTVYLGKGWGHRVTSLPGNCFHRK